jgi:hypothetical protein
MSHSWLFVFFARLKRSRWPAILPAFKVEAASKGPVPGGEANSPSMAAASTGDVFIGSVGRIDRNDSSDCEVVENRSLSIQAFVVETASRGPVLGGEANSPSMAAASAGDVFIGFVGSINLNVSADCEGVENPALSLHAFVGQFLSLDNMTRNGTLRDFSTDS